MDTFQFKILEEEKGERIDKFLVMKFPDYSRTFFQNLMDKEMVLVNQKSIKANYKLRNNDVISLQIPEPKEIEVIGEEIPLDILYEDKDVLIVNKPKGMVVHPSAGHENGTLVNAILHHCHDELSGINGEIRPGIVHRIDMDTTGSLIICKNDVAHQKIAEQIAEHTVNRIYVGLVHGRMHQEEGTIHTLIGRSPKDRKKMAVLKDQGREAITHYKVLEQFKNAAYVEFKLETGRTHQIRVHMSHIGHPLLGDKVYGNLKGYDYLQGQTLHAKTIGFVHPSTMEYVEFHAPMPSYFTDLLDKLRKNS